jgi:uncharacterized membrane protein YhdT
MNNLAIAGALATAPSTAYAELRERPRFWFPLLLIVLTSTAMVYWYYSVVDIEWLKDAMFSQNPKIQAMPEAQRAAAMGMMSRTTMLWGSVAGSLIALPIVFLLVALYFLVAAKVTKQPQGFKHWFAFTCWSSLPVLLGTVVSAIVLLMSSSPQISPSSLQALSVNELLFHVPLGSPAQPLLDSLTIPSFLSWALMIIGMHTWSQRSWVFSAIVVLIPSVVIYGIWSFLAFR